MVVVFKFYLLRFAETCHSFQRTLDHHKFWPVVQSVDRKQQIELRYVALNLRVSLLS